MTTIRALAKAATQPHDVREGSVHNRIPFCCERCSARFELGESHERVLAMQDVIDLAKELAESGLASDELRAALARLEAIR